MQVPVPRPDNREGRAPATAARTTTTVAIDKGSNPVDHICCSCDGVPPRTVLIVRDPKAKGTKRCVRIGCLLNRPGGLGATPAGCVARGSQTRAHSLICVAS